MECSDPVGTDGKTGEYPDLYTGRNGETCADRNGEVAEASSAMPQEEAVEPVETVQSQTIQPVIPETMPEEIVNTLPGEDMTQEESPAEAYIYYQGFKIDQEGMICGFGPCKKRGLTDGYLELPSENCIGIRRGNVFGSWGRRFLKFYSSGEYSEYRKWCVF